MGYGRSLISAVTRSLKNIPGVDRLVNKRDSLENRPIAQRKCTKRTSMQYGYVPKKMEVSPNGDLISLVQ